MAHKDDNPYFKARKEMKISQDTAAYDLLCGKISPDRLFRIESGKTPTPEEVCWMSEAYNKPELKNYYCNNDCEIGRTNGIDGVGEIEQSKLPITILQLLSSLNSIPKERLIDISADGKIDKDEAMDFIEIRKQLNDISKTIEALKIWADKYIEK